MGVAKVPYARAASTMQFPFLSETLIPSLNPLSQNCWFLWRRAVRDPYGAVGAKQKKILHQFFL